MKTFWKELQLPAVVEYVEGFNCCWSSLLETENEIDPFVQVRRHVIRFLTKKKIVIFRPVQQTDFELTRALRCWSIKSCGDLAQGGNSTSSTGNLVACRIPRSSRFMLTRNSGWQKNSGINSLTSLGLSMSNRQVELREWNCRSATSNLFKYKKWAPFLNFKKSKSITCRSAIQCAAK